MTNVIDIKSRTSSQRAKAARPAPQGGDSSGWTAAAPAKPMMGDERMKWIEEQRRLRSQPGGRVF